MRFLLLSSLFLLVAGCSSSFKGLPSATSEVSAIRRLKPVFNSTLYKAEIDVTGHYLSGLLLIKTMPDSSTRVLFTNEMGISFFDFAFLPDGEFKTYTVIKQMNRKPVIKTLRKDFQLLLMSGLDNNMVLKRADSNRVDYIFPAHPDYFQYTTDQSGILTGMRRSSRKKDIVSISLLPYKAQTPDSISITHHNFNFSIRLKKIER